MGYILGQQKNKLRNHFQINQNTLIIIIIIIMFFADGQSVSAKNKLDLRRELKF
jgi:hypothetical protein